MRQQIERIKGNEKGFTFIEIMIAMGVVVFVIVALIGANLAVQRNGEAAFQRAIAMQDANQVIEQMRNVASAGIFPNNVTGSFPDGAPVAGFANLTNEVVTVNYTDRDVSGDPLDDDPLDITVTVTWQENGVRAVSESLRTLVTQ